MKVGKNLAKLFIFLSALVIVISAFVACAPGHRDVEETEALTEDIPIIPQEDPTPSAVISGDTLTFSADHLDDGLTLHSGGDVDTERVPIEGSPQDAFRTGNCEVLPAADNNADFDVALRILVDDRFIFEGSPTSRVKLEVEYLDEGIDQFNIQYDSLDGGKFTDSEVITKTDTGQFQTAIFILEDAYFGNRQHSGDFRIWDRCDGPETIRRITLTLLDEVEAAVDPTPEPAAVETSSVVFYNGRILTVEDGFVTTAIEISGNKIVAVGPDEEILANADPNAIRIDLQDKTLMPGFIDTHTHWFNNVWREDLETGQQLLLSEGITTSAELFVEEDLILDLSAMDDAGELRVRVSLYPVYIDNCGDLRGDWFWPDYPVSIEPGAMLQIPGVKMFNDGGSCNRPAKSFAYPDGSTGDLYYPAEDLAAMMMEVQEKGYQVAVHGLGDRALEAILDAYEIVLDGGENTYRHRIEHNTLIRDDMLPRYSELDLVATLFGRFPACVFADGRFTASPEAYQSWEWRWRSLLDANPDVHFAWHSDTPYIGESKPLLELHGFVTRIDYREDGTVCQPPDWAADDALTVEEVLPMMTIEGAYTLLRDDEIGSLTAGKLADLIILSGNPLTVETDALRELRVLMTMVGGKVEFCLEGYEEYCP